MSIVGASGMNSESSDEESSEPNQVSVPEHKVFCAVLFFIDIPR